ncbi:tRNA delta(2)-isopentenylpyrophosphate transferase [Spiroplasma chinense]|uniref:tRNA dimethylallyltransferase n=1 Tax=Spiroplasma chinense TaxID=216932 RepID=A0A5B9Y3K8_9MOLU|nr:tRNA (adenosine(37)-N6)-dimethylallyltransferase MiaA [Spiroplasma chinense]QEH61738.1 tRNA delta(2)-isopentenylpyrophosphate transferase [Spiroplasma chinense]
MKKLVVIVGPTASGKTDLSIKIAKEFDGECINADSTQIFQGTDIATNKVTKEEMKGVKHHLLSTMKVNESYSVAQFQKEAREIIETIKEQNKLPIVVGGTGLYINALVMNYNFPTNTHTEGYITQFDDLSNEQLWEKLNQIDRRAAKIIHPNNRYRVIRALEIIELNGLNKSDIIKDNKTYFYDDLIIIGINPQRELLHNRINQRVLKLTDKGLFSEIEKAWLDNKKNEKAQALRCIGGPEIISYLKGEVDYETTISLMQRNNRRYARRQITWFKNQFEDVKWFTHDYDNFDKMCEDVLLYLKQVL